MPKVRSTRSKKRSFHGNRYTIPKKSDDNATSSSSKLNDDVDTASSSKLKRVSDNVPLESESINEIKGNRIFDLSTLIHVFSMLCCPECFQSGMQLNEDSKFGLCSNFSLVCQCGYTLGFTSTPKTDKKNVLNSFLVLGLRLIGKGYTAGKKLLFTLNLPCISKAAFRQHEGKLLKAVKSACDENMNKASKEVRELKNSNDCGVSVDGTWQRRGYNSLNGCVSVISIDTGKILDIEVMSQHCYICDRGHDSNVDHLCRNHQGSSGSMEVVGAYRIFERSVECRELCYTEYYGDGDSKGYMGVKDIYGKDSVKKLECIGHVQKRVGSRLRNLKKQKKGLGGKGKLTDKFIDKLQNYYGIAIRSNVGNLLNMQTSVIAAFFHCCSKNNEMHGQCPVGPDSWCKYKRALYTGQQISDKSTGLPDSIIKIIKPVYMSLCDQELLSKCLHGMTQNQNESFNSVLWTLLPKETFVGLQTMLLGSYIAVLLFNSGYGGLLHVFEMLGVKISPEIIVNYFEIDNVRIQNSKRKSLPTAKVARKKKRAARKSKLVKCELNEGVMYKCGEF